MSGKYALIIGNMEYTDSGLAQLTAPGKDTEDFARVLESPDICAFEDVKVLLNQSESVVSEAIDEFFDQKRPDDLLILYFSGHGVRDELGALYLAVKNTNRFRLRSTAIKSDFIREAMDQSRSKRQVLILDCCNSGAFAQGTKAATGVSIGTAPAFEAGYGRIILTASDSTQFAWEGDRVIGETANSLFTHFLVEGLKGEADIDGDGHITVDELYDYAYEKVRLATPKQTPSKFSSKQQGEIILRKSIPIEDIKPASLPSEIIDEIEDTRPYVREAAVQKLERLLRGRNIGLVRSATEALEKIAADENTTRRVAEAATQALQKAEEERQAKEEIERVAAQQAEEERIARDRAERKAHEEAQDLIAKVEAERLIREREEIERQSAKQAAKEKEERKAREEAEGLLAEKKAKEELIAKAKIEAERLAEEERVARAKFEADRFSKEKRRSAEKVKKETTSRKEIKEKVVVPEISAARPSWLTFGTMGIVLIAIILFVYGGTRLYSSVFNRGVAPAATQTASAIIQSPIVLTSAPTDIIPITAPTSGFPNLSEPRQSSNDGATLIYIPPGQFTMGITREQIDWFRQFCDTAGCVEIYEASFPEHLVELTNGYWIYRTEVSNAQYAQCVSSGGCQPPRASSSGSRVSYYDNPDFADHPVVWVDWDQANAYCSWAGGRLPTSAEWEYAARGSDKWLFPWGNDFPSGGQAIANVNNAFSDTQPVNEFVNSASPFGLLNTSGNVWEWVYDWYSVNYYRDNTNWTNPLGPSSGSYKVGRGGSWKHPVFSIAIQDWEIPNEVQSNYDYDGVGFRCVTTNP